MRAARVRAIVRSAFVCGLMLPAGALLPMSPAHAAAYRVLMSNYAFSPQTLTVPDGATVTWTNEDTAPHDVTTSSGPVAVHGSMLTKGQSWTYTFTTPGTYVYYCSFHPYMRAQLIVEPAPVAAATTAQAVAPVHSAAAQPTQARTTVNTPTPASPDGSSPAAVPPAAASSSTGPGTASKAPAVATASSAEPLNPLLLLAGLITGVAVLCLLLVGSRASRTTGE